MKKVIIFTLSTFCFLFFEGVNTVSAATYSYIDQETNRTMVPIRFISEELGATVKWEQTTKTVRIEKADKKMELVIGKKAAKVNGQKYTLDAVATTRKGTTYVPARFVVETLNAAVLWNQERGSVSIIEGNNKIELILARFNSTKLSKPSIHIGGRGFQPNVVKIDLLNPDIEMKVKLAKGQVGEVDSLANIARQESATVAINGTFFDAYTDNKEPYGFIVSEGRLAHIGRGKTVFGFDENKQVQFDILSPSIKGIDNSWYATWINRTPAKARSTSNIFTPDRGQNVGFNFGTNIVVENGKVVSRTTGNTEIPKNGFVLNLQGSLKNRFLPNFNIGDSVSYQVDLQTESGNDPFWNSIDGAIGAGPRLVKAGKVALNAKAEGFTEAKILTQAAARSAVGVTSDHYLLLVTVPSATMKDLAEIMKSLGAVDAMNLDGGASSGLYYNGKYVTAPGRQLSNALLIME